MVTIVDTSIAVWDFLKTSSLAATMRGMLIGEANNVLEAGDVKESILSDAVNARRTATTLDKALVVSVQDAGERPDPRMSGHFLQYVVVRVFDRNRGYRNIRTIRDELMQIVTLSSFNTNELSAAHRGILAVSYEDRTGHQWDSSFAVEYEAVSFSFRVLKKET